MREIIRSSSYEELAGGCLHTHSADFAKFIDEETTRYRAIIEKANIKVD